MILMYVDSFKQFPGNICLPNDVASLILAYQNSAATRKKGNISKAAAWMYFGGQLTCKRQKRLSNQCSGTCEMLTPRVLQNFGQQSQSSSCGRAKISTGLFGGHANLQPIMSDLPPPEKPIKSDD